MTRFSGPAGVALVFAIVAAAAAKDYEIKLARPVGVGSRYRVAITTTRQAKSTATINGQEQDPEDRMVSANLTARVEVLQVSRKMTALIEEFAVEKCTHVVDGKTVELLKPGTVVTVRANYTGPLVEVEGQELSDDELATLSELFSLNATEITDDDVFGTDQKHEPGDTWAMNTSSAVKLAKTAEVTIEDVAGKVTFVGTKEVGPTKCLELSATWTVGKLTPPADSLPPRFTLTKSTLKSNTWGLYPEDGKSLPVHERVTEDTTRVLSGTNANKQKIVASTVGRRVREIKRFPLEESVPAVGSKPKPKS